MPQSKKRRQTPHHRHATQPQLQPLVTTENTSIVSQQQSQQLTQLLLLSSLSAILFSRHLMREKSFQWIHFDVDAAGPWEYEAWKTGTVNAKHDYNTHRLPLLQQNGSSKTKAFMSYIEKGAFEAIELGYLRAFQLRIFEDINHPEKILEIYTLTFSYQHTTSPDGKVVSGFEMTGPEGKRASLRNLRIGFAEFMQNLLEFLEKLPDLPDKRYFKPKLFYTDECPPGYSPPGFKQGSASALIFPRAAGITAMTGQTSEYHGGYHSANMTVDYLQWTDSRKEPIPSGLRYSTPASQIVDISQSNTRSPSVREGYRRATEYWSQQNTSEQHWRGSSGNMGFQDSPAITESTTTNNSTTRQHDDHRMNASPKDPSMKPRHATHTIPQKRRMNELLPEYAAKRRASSRSGDQIDGVLGRPRTKRAANEEEIQLPWGDAKIQLESQDTATSSVNSQDWHERDALRRMRQRSKSHIEDTQILQPNEAHRRFPNKNTGEQLRISLTEAKINNLHEKRYLAQANNTQDLQREDDTVNCQCGWHKEEEDNMICCYWCQTWQHCSCYGFQGASDPRIPVQHTCYKCLFDGEDDVGAKHTLRELQNFALLRRGIQVIEENGGYYDKASFSRALGARDSQTASDTFAALLSEKAIVATKGSKKKGFSRTGKPSYHVVGEEPGRSEMIAKFFDPLYKIRHWYKPRGEQPNPRHNSLSSSDDQVIGTNDATFLDVSPTGFSGTLKAKSLSSGGSKPAHVNSPSNPSSVSEEYIPSMQEAQPNKGNNIVIPKAVPKTPRHLNWPGPLTSRLSIGHCNHGSPDDAFYRGMSAEQTPDEI